MNKYQILLYQIAESRADELRNALRQLIKRLREIENGASATREQQDMHPKKVDVYTYKYGTTFVMIVLVVLGDKGLPINWIPPFWPSIEEEVTLLRDTKTGDLSLPSVPLLEPEFSFSRV